MWPVFPMYFENDFLLKEEKGEEWLPNLSDLKLFDVRLKYSPLKAIRSSRERDTIFKAGEVKNHSKSKLNIFQKTGLGLEYKK